MLPTATAPAAKSVESPVAASAAAPAAVPKAAATKLLSSSSSSSLASVFGGFTFNEAAGQADMNRVRPDSMHPRHDYT